MFVCLSNRLVTLGDETLDLQSGNAKEWSILGNTRRCSMDFWTVIS